MQVQVKELYQRLEKVKKKIKEVREDLKNIKITFTGWHTIPNECDSLMMFLRDAVMNINWFIKHIDSREVIEDG